MEEIENGVFWRDDIGLWWPLADKDPETAYRFVAKRMNDSDATTKLCRKRRLCVQAGSYVGIWPLRLAETFEKVYCFEVMPGCQEASRMNCMDEPRIVLSNLGLGSADGVEVSLLPKATAGSWRIDEAGSLKATLTTIDSFNFKYCDALFLDIEGYEVEALKGAASTIARCKPIIHVEELVLSKDGIQKHLKSLGYREHIKIHKDVVYVPI